MTEITEITEMPEILESESETKDPAAETGDKTCARCRTVKPLAEFYIRRTNGRTPFSYCKTCFSEVSQNRRAVRRADEDVQARIYAAQLAGSGEIPPFDTLPISVRTHLLLLLDTEDRSASDVAARVGCSLGTVYRHRDKRRNTLASGMED